MKHIGQDQLGTGHMDAFHGRQVVESHNPVGNPFPNGLIVEAVKVQLVLQSPLADIEQQRIHQPLVLFQHFLQHMDRNPENR